MKNKDLYQNGEYFAFFCDENKKWIVCRIESNIKSKVLFKRDTFLDAKNCVDNRGVV
jgi:hypothetical protein